MNDEQAASEPFMAAIISWPIFRLLHSIEGSIKIEEKMGLRWNSGALVDQDRQKERTKGGVVLL
jgi:hypothetical protein